MSMISLLSPRGNFNRILACDSYKDGHFELIQKFPEILKMLFYMECRGGDYHKAVQFGQQMMLKMFFRNPLTMDDVYEAREFSLEQNGAFNFDGWKNIVENYGGWEPMEIWALPEGTVVPVSCPMTTVVNTGGNDTAFLGGHYETLLQRYSWVGTAVATNTFHTYKLIEKYMSLTDPEELVKAVMPYMMNDFGSRGTKEPLFTGGAFLTSFDGTDNKEAVYAMNHAYNTKMSGHSIRFASEHSIMTLKGEAGELDVAEKIIDTYGPMGCIFAMVIDGYSQKRFLEAMGTPRFKEKILKLASMGSKIVFRPDSGEPKDNLPLVIKTLMNTFGYSTNAKGFDVLPAGIGTIQGDGINRHSLQGILEALVWEKIAISNTCFGSGGGALEQFDRDFQKFAEKLCAVYEENIGWLGRNKCPEEAPWKASKAGQVGTYWKKDEIDAVPMSLEQLMALSPAEQAMYTNAMVPFWIQGKLLVNEDVPTLRRRLQSYKGTIFA